MNLTKYHTVCLKSNKKDFWSFVINLGIGIRVRHEGVVIYWKETCRQADGRCKLFMTFTKTRCQFISKCHNWN